MYKQYIKKGKIYEPSEEIILDEKLPAGAYELHYDEYRGCPIFKKINFTHDQLMDLPSPEFNKTVTEINEFLKPETRQTYKDFGFLYKRSILFHGVHGTGKTCLVNRIAQKVNAIGGITIFNPHPKLLALGLEAIRDIQPDIPIMVVFEELDGLIDQFENELLHILDGETQVEGVMYMATTNHIDRIPARIMRPGRFSSITEVLYPQADAREFYLREKFGNRLEEVELKKWVKDTDGLSIDEVKETVLATKCLKMKLKDVIVNIKKAKKKALEAQKSQQTNYQVGIAQMRKELEKMTIGFSESSWYSSNA